MAALAKQFTAVVRAEVTEVMAAREIVAFAKNLMIPKFSIEDEASSVIWLFSQS